MNTIQTTKTTSSLRGFLHVTAQPVRFNILSILKNGELCVCEIYEHLNIPQNLASHHLKVLSDHDLLTSRKQGQKIIYERNERELKKYKTLFINTI